MNIGQPGDRLSLARVLVATLGGGVALGAIGALFDVVLGPLIGQGGWWTVFATGGLIAGATVQAVREFATPMLAEREVVAAEARAVAASTSRDPDSIEGPSAP